MIDPKQHDRIWESTKQRRRRRTALGGITLGLLLSGCSIGSEFRAAAVPALETGVNAILDGFVDGIFAVIDPDDPQGDNQAGR